MINSKEQVMLVRVTNNLRSLKTSRRPMTFGKHLQRMLTNIVECMLGCNFLATLRYVGDSKLHPYFELYVAYWGLPFHELGERPFFAVRKYFFDNEKPTAIKANVLSCIDELCNLINYYLTSDQND